MWKAALAGAFALATIGSSSVLADGLDGWSPAYTNSTAPGVSAPVTQVRADPAMGMIASRIAQFKAALRLTAEQERHWPRVEAVLRQIAQDHTSQGYSNDAAPRGFVQRVGERASEMAMSANAIRRLVAAAQPLIKSLDQGQKRDALMLARNMGFGSVAAQLE